MNTCNKTFRCLSRAICAALAVFIWASVLIAGIVLGLCLGCFAKAIIAAAAALCITALILLIILLILRRCFIRNCE